MKYIYILLAIALASSKCFSQSFVQAQSVSKPKFVLEEKKKKPSPKYVNLFSIYPLRALASYLMVGYEGKVSRNKAVKFIAGYASLENAFLYNIDILKYNAVRLELQYKYFLGKKANVFEGFYCAPNLMFKKSNYQYEDGGVNLLVYKGVAQATMLGLVIGYQIPIGEMVNIDAYVGQSVMWASGDFRQISDRTGDTYSNDIGIQAGICIGIGF